MIEKLYTVEDCLECLVGLKNNFKFQIESSDYSILTSIARQVFKGTALTDKQYDLIKLKLKFYEDQFLSAGIIIEDAVQTLRIPLRQIDRSKYITVVKHSDTVGPNSVYESYKEHWYWIKIRFPFSKKSILLIEELLKNTPSNKYQHNKGSHEHYFIYNEKNTYEIIKHFKEKSFVIDQELLEIYERLEYMNNNRKEFIPGVYNFKLKNLSDRAINYMISSIGEPSKVTLAQYVDRKKLFGLDYFDIDDVNESISYLTSLSKKIVNRKHSQVFIKNTLEPMSRVAESIVELNRFPLLVIIPENDPLSYLSTVHESFKGVVDPSEITVMFRLDNQNNSDFNDYIRQKEINNRLDNNTKIVYISNNNVPKPLVMSDWRPSSALLLSSSRHNTKINTYIEELDLVIHYDSEPSQFMRRNLDIL